MPRVLREMPRFAELGADPPTPRSGRRQLPARLARRPLALAIAYGEEGPESGFDLSQPITTSALSSGGNTG
jgi:hypothetical protein